jgi:hypothetical protein
MRLPLILDYESREKLEESPEALDKYRTKQERRSDGYAAIAIFFGLIILLFLKSH